MKTRAHNLDLGASVFGRAQNSQSPIADSQWAQRLKETASTLIVVLWICFGLVSLAIWFAGSMAMEYRAADATVRGLEAEQAIEGARRYVNWVLQNQPTNGFLPDRYYYEYEGVPVGNESEAAANAHFWLIGRDTNYFNGPMPVSFGLVDEASKINLNMSSSGTNFAVSNILFNLLCQMPTATPDLLMAMLDWRDTNGGSGSFDMYYNSLSMPYQNKAAPYETVDEIRHLYAAYPDTLIGNDNNRNGVLDPNENSMATGISEPGILEYLTVYSREPTTYSNGMLQCVSIASVASSGPLATLLQAYLPSRASAILSSLGVSSGGGGGSAKGGKKGGGGTAATSVTFRSPLEFYRKSGMTPDEFALIADALTLTSTNESYTVGRININTAGAQVLASLPGIGDDPSTVQSIVETLMEYRAAYPDQLTTIAWIVDALGSNNTQVLDALQASDCITVHSYQFTADVAAVGAYGRGYRRVRFVFDTVDGTPKIVYRRDITHLGWALGEQWRRALLYPNQNQ